MESHLGQISQALASRPSGSPPSPPDASIHNTKSKEQVNSIVLM